MMKEASRNISKAIELVSSSQRRRFLGVFLIMMVAALIEALGVVSVFPFLGVVMEPSRIQSNTWLRWAYESFGFTSDTQFLVVSGTVVLLLLICTNVMRGLSDWAQIKFSTDLKHDFSVRVLRRYLGRPYSYFLRHNTAELKKNVLDETNRLVNGIYRPGLMLLSKIAVVIAIFSLLIVVDPKITLGVVAAIGGPYTLIYLRIRNQQKKLGTESVEASEERFRATQEALGGFKELKVLSKERTFLGMFVEPSRIHQDHQAKHNIVARLPRYVIQSLAFGGMMGALVLLLAVGVEVSRIVPLMGTFAFAGYRLLPAFQSILQSLTKFRFHDESLQIVHGVLHADTSPGLGVPRESIDPMPFNDSIALEGVDFSYPNTSESVVTDVSMEIPKEDSVAFVGSTGAGKTTLVDILMGLLRPQEGELLVDGVPITTENVRNWRKNIGYIPQDIYLSDTTIERNIAFGVPEEEIDREAVRKAARIAQAHQFIAEDLPNGYETVVGERGVRLSGGQRQRIGIARAVYHDPPVLVMDEATSDIDSVTEAKITEAIRELSEDKTLIIVAHRLSTVRHCDTVYFIDGGQVVARGTYDELVQEEPRFRRMTEALQATKAGT